MLGLRWKWQLGFESMNAATGGFLIQRDGCRRVFDYSEPLFFRSKTISEYRDFVVCQPLCQFFGLRKNWRHRRTLGGRFAHLKVIANAFHQFPNLRFTHGDKLPLSVTGVLPIGGHFSRFPCHMLFFSFLDEITSDAPKSSGKSVADVLHGFSRTRQINKAQAATLPHFGSLGSKSIR